LRGAWEEQNADRAASGLLPVESTTNLIEHLKEKKIKQFENRSALPGLCIAKNNVVIGIIEPLQTYAETTNNRIVEMACTPHETSVKEIQKRVELRPVADTMVFNLSALLDIQEIVEAAGNDNLL